MFVLFFFFFTINLDNILLLQLIVKPNGKMSRVLHFKEVVPGCHIYIYIYMYVCIKSWIPFNQSCTWIYEKLSNLHVTLTSENVH